MNFSNAGLALGCFASPSRQLFGNYSIFTLIIFKYFNTNIFYTKVFCCILFIWSIFILICKMLMFGEVLHWGDRCIFCCFDLLFCLQCWCRVLSQWFVVFGCLSDYCSIPCCHVSVECEFCAFMIYVCWYFVDPLLFTLVREIGLLFPSRSAYLVYFISSFVYL